MEKSFVTGAWQQTRAFSPAVITKGEQTIVWVAGHTALPLTTAARSPAISMRSLIRPSAISKRR